LKIVGSTTVSVPSCCLRLPAPTQRLVELHHGKQFVSPVLRELKLVREQALVGRKSIQERIHPAVISHIRQAHAVANRLDQQLLLNTYFPGPATLHQRVRDIAEGGLDLLLILHDRVLFLGLGEPDARFQAAPGEDWLAHLRHKVPGAGGAGE
jgi:hypothetical protein